MEGIFCSRISYRFLLDSDNAEAFGDVAADVVFWPEGIPGHWCVSIFQTSAGDRSQAFAGQRNVAMIPSKESAFGILSAWLMYRKACNTPGDLPE